MGRPTPLSLAALQQLPAVQLQQLPLELLPLDEVRRLQVQEVLQLPPQLRDLLLAVLQKAQDVAAVQQQVEQQQQQLGLQVAAPAPAAPGTAAQPHHRLQHHRP